MNRKRTSLLASFFLFAGILSPATAQVTSYPARGTPSEREIEAFRINEDITLRRLIIRNPQAGRVVLLLHGFPETIRAWDQLADELKIDHEVHAFDWPGFGSSSRPAPRDFAYGPSDYAQVLREYVSQAGIDRSKLVIYATDIGGLPALLAAIDDPSLASGIVVSDFAPFDRPDWMQERLRALKSAEANEAVRLELNKTRDEILENAMRRGLDPEEQFEISDELRTDMASGWGEGPVTAADAFAMYYAQFTRDQLFLEANLERLNVPLAVIWGAKDVYLDPKMGVEFARRTNASFKMLRGIGHYPHLQDPVGTANDIREMSR